MFNHSIKVASRRSGLSPHVIRVWEKRYGVIRPERTDTNRRLYSEEDIEKLTLLRQAIGAGHSIGSLSQLTPEQLRGLLFQEDALKEEFPSAPPASSRPRDKVATLHLRALEAVKRLDAAGLEAVLDQAGLLLGAQGVLTHLIGPLAESIGQMWQAGEITAAQEHLASAILRVFMGHSSRSYALPDSAPCLIAATPVGQLHELGAVMAAATAANAGWRVAYLGPSLPAVEIAGAALQNQARVVALSIVYPEDDPSLPGELTRLRKLLPPTTKILAGGRAVIHYRDALEQAHAEITTDLDQLFNRFVELRSEKS